MTLNEIIEAIGIEPYYREDAGVIYCGDCMTILPRMLEKCVDAIITDPIWPGHTFDYGIVDPEELFALAGLEFAKLTDRLVIHLGCDTDPRILRHIPDSLPFFRVCWLRWVPARYKGSLLNGADVAYAFGHRKIGEKGTRVVSGETTAVSQGHKDYGITHPTPRHQDHVNFLVANFTRPGDLILDPFCGSGTVMKSAKNGGRKFIGMDIVEKYCEESVQRLSQEVMAV